MDNHLSCAMQELCAANRWLALMEDCVDRGSETALKEAIITVKSILRQQQVFFEDPIFVEHYKQFQRNRWDSVEKAESPCKPFANQKTLDYLRTQWMLNELKTLRKRRKAGHDAPYRSALITDAAFHYLMARRRLLEGIWARRSRC